MAVRTDLRVDSQNTTFLNRQHGQYGRPLGPGPLDHPARGPEPCSDRLRLELPLPPAPGEDDAVPAPASRSAVMLRVPQTWRARDRNPPKRVSQCCRPLGLRGDRLGRWGWAEARAGCFQCEAGFSGSLAPCGVDGSGTNKEQTRLCFPGAAPSTTRRFHLRPVCAGRWGGRPTSPRTVYKRCSFGELLTAERLEVQSIKLISQ